VKKNIVWLASYPKSGNTWLRIFMANYVMNRMKPLPINEVRRFGTGDAVAQSYRRIGGPSADLSDPQVTARLRPQVLRAIVANNADVNLVKTHNVRAHAMGVDLIPTNLTRAAIYVMRNPLDMVLSYARHYGLEARVAAISLGCSDTTLLADKTTVHSFLGSWSDHVKSWTRKPPFPTLVLRYEDMLAQPEATFGRVVEHIGMPPEPDRLKRAIEFSSFDEVSKQEQKTGFGERSHHSDRFFGKGTSGHWREELDPKLVQIIRRDHKAVMKEYGYWNE
jgi:hypothetical protein